MTHEQKLQGIATLIRMIWEELHTEESPWPGDEVAALKLLFIEAQEVRRLIFSCHE